ncbi:MAG TPA: hypothetical protein VMD91_01450 [Candidatus Sulfotelmatobacter sp.]|nr:hypothetical protein [Candidatus Sulfotelmatobacter sp.]
MRIPASRPSASKTPPPESPGPQRAQRTSSSPGGASSSAKVEVVQAAPYGSPITVPPAG